MRGASITALVCFVVACGGASPRPAASFAEVIATDPQAAPFAEDAELTVIAGPTVRGRAAIGAALDSLRARFPGLHLATGRQWSRGTTHVVELVMTAPAIGVAAAAVVTLDRAGLISAARIYVDVPTLVGQMAPHLLPEGVTARAPIAGPLHGTTATVAGDTPTEAASFATTEAIWARLDAHDPAGVLVSSAPGYVYDDYSGPAPLDLAGTHKLLDGFMGLVQDFKIVEKPTYFAAGAFVITESVENMLFQGKPIVLHGLDIKEFAEGKVVREWQYANGAEVLSALLGISVAVPEKS